MRRWISASALLLALTACAVASNNVGPGSPAPKLDIKTWYKGDKVTGFDNDKLYVVEFWATWCGPCKQSIPHLTELAKKNPDVKFVGVSIWEDDTDNKIQKFVADMGDKMNYSVAYSGNKTGMSESWMQASGQNGIPTAFVVKSGKIEWIGHPMELEEPLAQIKSGKFDEAGFKTKFEKSQAAQEAQMKSYRELQRIEKLHTDGKKPEAYEALAKLENDSKADQGIKMQVANIRLRWYATDDSAKWKQAVADYSKDPQKAESLAMCAMELAKTNPDKAREAIAAADAGSDGKVFFVTYYSVMTYKELKDYAKALESANKLLEMVPNSPFKGNTQVIDELKQIQSEVAKLASKSK
jgi:thiol-disulfide isomerase/thioredoxin